MRHVSATSFHGKIARYTMLCVTLALVLASGGFMLFGVVSARRAAVNNLSINADYVGNACVAAIRFGDELTATDALSILRSEPRIVAAAVYTADGALFARYARDGSADEELPASPRLGGMEFGRRHVELFRSILAEGQRLGTVYIRRDLEDLRRSLGMGAGVVAGVLIASLIITLASASRFQRTLTAPVTELVRTANAVAATQDYALRAERLSTDELGTLTDRFNSMLEEIRKRDTALHGAQDQLEERVRERTRALKEQQVAALNMMEDADAARRNAEGVTRTLKETLEELSRSNEELQRFAYIASHDLQEPLRKIIAFGSLLEKEASAGLPDEGRDYVARMQNSASRMQDLINDLLSFSRLTTRARPFENVDLNETVRGVLSDLEQSVHDSSGSVTVEDLPTLEAEPVQMRQLMQNLISNALKFHREEAPPAVTITATTTDSSSSESGAPGTIWKLAVKDNGIGFDEKYHDRIFTIFQRLHARHTYGGTGIGLALCRKIVERHEGRIWASSEPGQGATFYVELPARQAPREPTPAHPEATPA